MSRKPIVDSGVPSFVREHSDIAVMATNDSSSILR